MGVAERDNGGLILSGFSFEWFGSVYICEYGYKTIDGSRWLMAGSWSASATTTSAAGWETTHSSARTFTKTVAGCLWGTLRRCDVEAISTKPSW